MKKIKYASDKEVMKLSKQILKENLEFYMQLKEA